MRPIEELHLSTRCRNALRQAGIISVEMLEEVFTKGDRVKYLPGVGARCFNEVKLELIRLELVKLETRKRSFHLPHIKLPHIKVVWR